MRSMPLPLDRQRFAGIAFGGMGSPSSRDLVLQTLASVGPRRVPRFLFDLPWAALHFPEEYKKLRADYPDDFLFAQYPGLVTYGCFQTRPRDPAGDPFEIGVYVDECGCVFQNRQRGVIGEVREALIRAEDWSDQARMRIPEECLRVDADAVNRFCGGTGRFVFANAWPRIFERLQFLRGSQQLFIDLALRPPGMLRILRKFHEFHCRLLEAWARTDVDGLLFQDDWGSQNSLLINPELWVEVFKPLYRDYIEIAHARGKKIFMHSDGYILDILPHLVELGLDAINCQVALMGVEKLAPFKGRITFWGDVDKQHTLVRGTVADVEREVRRIREHLWHRGGCIAACEFGPGGRPENVRAVFEAWDRFRC
jgi:uroporphyrinogen decarboxylase